MSIIGYSKDTYIIVNIGHNYKFLSYLSTLNICPSDELNAVYYYENFAGMTLDFSSGFRAIEYAYWQKSDNKRELLEDCVKMWENKGEDERTWLIIYSLGWAYAWLGRRYDALRIIQETGERFKDRRATPMVHVEIYAALGEKKKAMNCLEKLYQDSSGWIINLKANRLWRPFLYDTMYPEPEFQELLKKVGLEE